MEQWSELTQESTRNRLKKLSFGSLEGKVYCKHFECKFGYMMESDVINGIYHLYLRTGEDMGIFKSIDDMLDAGWVLD